IRSGVRVARAAADAEQLPMKMAVRLGELRTRASLEENIRGENDSRGHRSERWVKRADLNVKLRQLSGTEMLAFHQLYPVATCIITTHFLPSVQPAPSWRVVVGDRQFEIVAVNDIDNQHRMWEFVCAEQVKVRDGDTR